MAKKIRIVIDTNWYISATINKKSRRTLYELITDNRLVIILSTEIIREYKLVIVRDKFKKYISADQATRFINLITSNVEKVESKSDLKGGRDDNYLLSLSLDGKADYLITGDLDLLTMGKTNNTEIVTLDVFLKTYRS